MNEVQRFIKKFLEREDFRDLCADDIYAVLRQFDLTVAERQSLRNTFTHYDDKKRESILAYYWRPATTEPTGRA